MVDVRQRLAELVSDNLLGLALSLGLELKLFDTIAAIATKDKPASALEIAQAAGLKERYTKEWLCCVACGGMVEMNESGERFWLKSENVNALSGTQVDHSLALLSMVPHFAGITHQLKNVYRKDGPIGMSYDDFREIHKYIDIMGQTIYDKHLITDFVPLAGVRERLESGCNVLDVGCGTGSQCTKFAKQFPRSNFTGVDLCHDAIVIAQGRKMKESLQNVTFLEIDASQLPKQWFNTFDWVTIFDACHDQTRPDLSLREIHRILKKDGLLSVVEINGSSNPYTDKKLGGYGATFLYAISAFHCLPIGSNSPDALCLGTMWGQRRALELFEKCGFSNVQAIPTPFFKWNVLYNCTK